LAEVFVRCPKCGYRAMLDHGNQHIIDIDGQCRHKQDPENCPVLRPALLKARKALDDVGG
jgi:hypothetical protein